MAQVPRRGLAAIVGRRRSEGRPLRPHPRDLPRMLCETRLLWVFLLALRSRLVLLWCRLVLLRLRCCRALRWCCLALLRLRSCLALLLRRTLTLLRLRSCLALLLRGSLTLLRLRKRLALLLLLLRSHFALLWRYLALLLRGSLALLRLRKRLALLLRRSLTLLRLRNCLALLLLRSRLALLLLRSPLAPLLLRRSLTLLLLRSRLALLLLLLLYNPIRSLQRRWSSYIAIGRKRMADSHIGRAAMIRTGKLGPVGSGGTLILHLSTHGRSVRLMHRRQLRRMRRRPDTTRSAVITHAGVVGVAGHRAAVDVVHQRDVDVVDRAVVVEVASTPVTALVAVSNVAITVVDAAIVADVLTPVAWVKPVEVIPVAPVARGPECALVGSLNPCAGHPVIAVRRPGPIAGRPDIVVAGDRRLVVVGQGRRRLGRGVFRLRPVTWIVRRLVRRRRTLLVAWGGVGLVLRSAGVVRNGGQVGRRRVRARVLRARLVIGRGQGLILMAAGS